MCLDFNCIFRKALYGGGLLLITRRRNAPRCAMLPAPPPLPRWAALPAAQQAQIRALTAAHGLSDAAVVPSLYLHLALWPEFLALLPELLAPLQADGGLVRVRNAALGSGAPCRAGVDRCSWRSASAPCALTRIPDAA